MLTLSLSMLRHYPTASRNPFVANVAPSLNTASGADQFATDYTHWPLEHFQETYAVPTLFLFATDPFEASFSLPPRAREAFVCTAGNASTPGVAIIV